MVKCCMECGKICVKDKFFTSLFHQIVAKSSNDQGFPFTFPNGGEQPTDRGE